MSTSNLDLETKHVTTAPGIKLSEHQETIVGSVLDLFAGRPSLAKLALWRDDATFSDPLTIATGRKQYAAQWYGLQKAFSEIDRLNHHVRDAGNPILMDLRTKYVIRGIGKEQMIQSLVAIHLDDQGKIVRVEDKWNGELPEGMVAKVCSENCNFYCDILLIGALRLFDISVPRLYPRSSVYQEAKKKTRRTEIEHKS
jgi:hypothetical protein